MPKATVECENASIYRARLLRVAFTLILLRIPGTLNLDLGMTKDTRLTERIRLQFRAEFFNILDHTNLGAPTANGNFTLNSSCVAAGGAPSSCVSIPTTQAQITQPNPGALSREIQLGLKLVF